MFFSARAQRRPNIDLTCEARRSSQFITGSKHLLFKPTLSQVEIVVGFLEKHMLAEVRSDFANLFCSSSVLWIRRWTFITISRRTDANHIARPVGLNSPYLFPDINSRLFLSFSWAVAHAIEWFSFKFGFSILYFYVFLRPRAASIQHLLDLHCVNWRETCRAKRLQVSWQ